MSGIYEFDENLGQSFEASAAEAGIEDGQQDPGAWDGFASGVGQGVMRETFARTGQTVGMAGAVLPIIGDAVNSAITGRYETRAQDWYFKNIVDDTVNNAVDYWAPGPQEVGKAGQLVGSLVGGLGQLVIGAGNPSLMVANAQMGTAVDMVRSGVDAETAQQVGAVAGVATAVGAWLPIFGKSASSKIATGTIGNIAQGIVQRGATGEILDEAGYSAQAKNFDAFDLQSMAVDGLMGVAFGGLQAKSKYQQPNVLDSVAGKKAGDAIRGGSQSLEDSISSMIGNAVLTKTHKDAIAALATFKSYAIDSAPGRPLSDADFNAHQATMDDALNHLLFDKPFDDSMVRDAAFEQKPPRADAEDIRSELPSYKETAAPVNPAEYAAARYAEMAKESGLSDEQAANMAKYHEPDISPVTGRYSDHELLGAVARAAKGDTPYRYVEMDTTKLGKINARKGANDAADDFIKDTGDALQAIYGDVPVYHRGAGRFAALVPEGFDVEAAQAQAKEALTGITKKHGVDDLDVQMYHGENPVPKGEALDKAIKPAQDKLNASKPEDTSDVAGIEGIKAWADTSTGSAREVSRRIEEATGSLQQGSGDLESTARYIARSLERQSTATEVKQAGGFLSPDEYRAKSVAEDAQKNSLSPEQTALHNKKILRDELTGAYRAVDRNPTVKRVQDYIQETGKPAVFAVADVSNLGGKNLALGQHTADIIFKQYHEIIMDNLNALGADVVPFRHGGDETSYIVVGAEESVVREAMAKAAADVQRFANRVGIADLPHKKTYTSEVVSGAKPRDTSKDGSGIYVGVNEIHPGKTPREIYAAGDREVDFNKYAGKVDVAGETMPLKSDTAKDPMSGYAARPEVKQALTADESITVLDDNGNPVSGREAILQAAAEADNAVSLKEGFKAAALCAMRFTT